MVKCMKKESYRFRISTKKVKRVEYAYLQLVHRVWSYGYGSASTITVKTLYRLPGPPGDIRELLSSLDIIDRVVQAKNEK